jgi:hypothetical protein
MFAKAIANVYLKILINMTINVTHLASKMGELRAPLM